MTVKFIKSTQYPNLAALTDRHKTKKTLKIKNLNSRSIVSKVKFYEYNLKLHPEANNIYNLSIIVLKQL